ncbi:MAG: AlpA family phage regulatory protein [Caldilineae bacterium]|nr:MAG: AlpA family phage regulatory protein [Caldilineae bacterium]
MRSDNLRILRPAEAAKALGVSRSTLYHWCKHDPDFPPRIQIGPRSTGWLESDLLAWLESRRKMGLKDAV